MGTVVTRKKGEKKQIKIWNLLLIILILIEFFRKVIQFCSLHIPVSGTVSETNGEGWCVYSDGKP